MDHHSLAPREWAGVRGWVARRPVLAFLVWFFTIGQGLAFTPLIADSAYGINVPRQPFVVASTLIGLLFPALFITRLVDGPEGLRRLCRRVTISRFSVAWYGVASVLIPVVAIGLTVAIYGVPRATATTVAAAVVQGFLLQTFLVLVTNNLWEELAWMGFVQARLQRRHGPLRAAILTAPLFVCQHAALFASSGNSFVVAVILVIVLSVIAIPFRALLGAAYNSTGSLLLVGMIHAMGNGMTSGSGLWGGEGLLPRLFSGEFVGLTNQLTGAIIGLAVIMFTRGRLWGATTPGTATRPGDARNRVGGAVR